MQHKYKAFISYSHRDTAFASWLHKTLETFAIPSAIVGTESPLGVVPSKLFPVFRDREELPTATDLGHVIENALTESASLLVLCSPRSAASMWVNQEVLNYQRIHGVRNIIAVIIDGDFDPVQPHKSNALVPALQALLTPVAPLTSHSQIRLVDARGNKTQRQQAFIALLSYMLGQPLETLQQQINARKRKRAMLASVAAIALLGGIWGIQQHFSGKQRIAEQAELQARLTKQLDAIQNDLGQQKYNAVLIQGNSLIQQHSNDLSPAQRNSLMSQLHNALSNNQHIALLDAHQAKISQLLLNKDNSRLLSVDEAHTVVLWDTQSWQVLKRWQLKNENGYDGNKTPWFSADGKQLIIYSGHVESKARFQVFNSKNGSEALPELIVDNVLIVDIPFWQYQPDMLLTRRFVPQPNGEPSERWLDIYNLELQKQQSFRVPRCGEYFDLRLVLSIPQTKQLLIADKTCGGFVFNFNSPDPVKNLPELQHSIYSSFNVADSIAIDRSSMLLKPDKGQYAIWKLPELKLTAQFSLQQLTNYKINAADKSIDIYGCDDDNSWSCKTPVALRISQHETHNINTPFAPRLQQQGQKRQVSAQQWLIQRYKTLKHVFDLTTVSADIIAFEPKEDDSPLVIADSAAWFAIADGNMIYLRSLTTLWQNITALSIKPEGVMASPSGNTLLIAEQRNSPSDAVRSFISNTSFVMRPTSIAAAIWYDHQAIWSQDEKWVLLSAWVNDKERKQVLLNVADATIATEFEEGAVKHAVFSNDSKTLHVYLENNLVKTLTLSDNELQQTEVQLPDTGEGFKYTALTNDRNILAVAASMGETLSLYNTQTGKLIAQESYDNLQLSSDPNSLHFTKDMQHILIGQDKAALKMLDTLTLAPKPLRTPAGYYISDVVNNDLLLLGNSSSVLLWSLSKQTTLFDLTRFLPAGSKYVGEYHWYEDAKQLLITPNAMASPFLLNLAGEPTVSALLCDGIAPDNYALNLPQHLLIATFDGNRNDDNNKARLCVADLQTGNIYLNTLLPSHFVINVQYFPDTKQVVLLLHDGIRVTYQLRHTDIDWIKQGAALAVSATIKRR